MGKTYKDCCMIVTYYIKENGDRIPVSPDARMLCALMKENVVTDRLIDSLKYRFTQPEDTQLVIEEVLKPRF